MRARVFGPKPVPGLRLAQGPIRTTPAISAPSRSSNTISAGSKAGWARERAALDHYRQAAALPSDYCFPARLEEIGILESAIAANPRDARAPLLPGQPAL